MHATFSGFEIAVIYIGEGVWAFILHIGTHIIAIFTESISYRSYKLIHLILGCIIRD